MGRNYIGDISGKFWVGVQDSDDASFFGGEEIEPSYLEYYFDAEHLDEIKSGVEKCKKELGDWKERIDIFFKGAGANGYNDDIVIKAGFDAKEFRMKLEWYARLELGEKILACVEEKGSCAFEAEL